MAAAGAPGPDSPWPSPTQPQARATGGRGGDRDRGRQDWWALHCSGPARCGWRVAARKPAQSYAPDDAPSSTDAAVLGWPAVSRQRRCAWHTGDPVPWPRHGRTRPRRPPHAGELAVELEWPEGPGCRLIETAGGVRSPLADDGDTADWCACSSPTPSYWSPTPASHHQRRPLERGGAVGEPLVVVLNRFAASNELHEANRQWLVERDGFSVVVVPATRPRWPSSLREQRVRGRTVTSTSAPGG